MKNEYYSIAYNDLLYLQATLHLPFYNNIAVNAQQVAEKVLKSVVEIVSPDAEGILKTHNLRGLYNEISKYLPAFELNQWKLSMLKDIYFDAKYPGDNFMEIDQKTCDECLSIMYDTIEAVNQFRAQEGLDIFTFNKLYTFNAID